MENDRAKSRVEQSADLLDVHLLDIAAQLEALLRGVRDVQRGVLRVRGVPLPGEESPATHVRHRLSAMLQDCQALRDAILQAEETAADLARREAEAAGSGS